ncbi:MAG: hypothetical protein ACE5GK_10075 [Nitrospiria bacterium]
MNCFFKAKIPSFCVANFENSGLFSAICALNLKILSLEKFNPDLIRGSLVDQAVVPQRDKASVRVKLFQFAADLQDPLRKIEKFLMGKMNACSAEKSKVNRTAFACPDINFPFFETFPTTVLIPLHAICHIILLMMIHCE